MTFDRPVAVLDVDGTVADGEWRLPLLGAEPGAASRQAWAAFFDAAGADRPIPAGVALALNLAIDHDIQWLTARSDRIRSLTAAWLLEHELPTGELVMRPDDDLRISPVWKLEQLHRIAAVRSIAVVVDDDLRVLDLAAEQGFPVQLAPGAASSQRGR